MIKKEWENVLSGQEVRQALSKIRQEIKDSSDLELFKNLIDNNTEKLAALLESEDAKTRKNAALLMGDLGDQEFLAAIWTAYLNETQRFVKSAYLSAIANFDYHIYKEEIKKQLELLRASELTPENEKHVMEEIRELSSLLIHLEGVQAHTFTGWDLPYDIILLTNRNFTGLVGDELLASDPKAQIKSVGAGVMAKVTNLSWLRNIRIYQELLFLIPGMATCPMEPSAVAAMIMKSGLISFLEESHEGTAPFYYRLEMKSKKPLGEKSRFLKKLVGQIEIASNRQLINSTDNYEIEIRLIENKQGDCNIMVKLFTIRDGRFTYRQEVMPTSIKPVNAALTVALAKEYMEEDAQVLDPFCGVGTMLIERHKAVRANTTYGVDIQEEAILKARHNTDIAKQVIHYVNRDFFQFTHDYLFDEVITNMPFQIGRVTDEDVENIYQRFFHKIPQHLKEGALLVLYSHDRELLKQMIFRTDFRLLKEYEIGRREGTHVFILRYK